MPTPMDAMLGLVVLALGVLGWIVAFSIADAAKRKAAYVLAALLCLTGGYYFVTSEMRGLEMRRRLSTLQRQQQINLNEIQQRLKQQSENK